MSALDPVVVDDIVVRALAEDFGVAPDALLRAARTGGDAGLRARDVTTASVVALGSTLDGCIVAREAGVVCGLAVAARAFEVLAQAFGASGQVEFAACATDGDEVSDGSVVATVTGDAAVVLGAERTALNAVMVLSGIATTAARWQRAAGNDVAVLDTRKTLPGLRSLSKWAVACGGAHPHRQGLWEMVLVKDNHVRLAGGLAAAVRSARAVHPELIVEVEADTVEQAAEAALAGADVVLLDNMGEAMLRAAVAAVRAASAARGARVLTEASGGITFERLAQIAATGVDRVSTSALGIAPPLDFGFDEQHTAG